MLFGRTKEEYNKYKHLFDVHDKLLKELEHEVEKLKARVERLEDNYNSLKASFASRSRYAKREYILEYLQDLAKKNPERAKEIAEQLGIDLKII